MQGPEDPLDWRTKQIAEAAARAWLLKIGIAVFGAMGLSILGFATWLFVTVPDAAVNKAMAIIEVRTLNIAAGMTKTLDDFGFIKGQTAALNADLALSKSLATTATTELGNVRGTITTYTDQIAGLKKEQDKAELLIAALATKRQELETQVKALNDQRAMLDKDLKQADKDLGKLRTKLELATSLIDFMKEYTPQDWRTFRERVTILSQAGKEIDVGKRLDEAVRSATASASLVSDRSYGNEPLRRDLNILRGDFDTKWKLLSITPANTATPDFNALAEMISELNRIVLDGRFGNQAIEKSLVEFKTDYDKKFAEFGKKEVKPPPAPNQGKKATKKKKKKKRGAA